MAVYFYVSYENGTIEIKEKEQNSNNEPTQDVKKEEEQLFDRRNFDYRIYIRHNKRPRSSSW